MNQTPYQAEDKVLIEPYCGPTLEPIRTRPARRSLAHLRRLADADDVVPTRNALTWMRGVIGYPLGRFVKMWMLLPIFLITLTFEVRYAISVSTMLYRVPRCPNESCYRHRLPILAPHYSAYDYNTFAGPEILLGIIVLLLILGLIFRRRGARYASFPPTHSFAVAQYWGSNDIVGTWVGQRDRVDLAP